MKGLDESRAAVESLRERVTWRQIAEGIGTAILLAVVLTFVVYAVPQVVGADQSYVALSGSMEPAISPGDAIIVEEVEPSAVERGDVITFKRPSESRTTTHRVVEVVETDDGIAYRTKGDANEDADHGTVPPSQLQGKVMTVGGHLVVLPYLGHLVGFARTRIGFATLVVAPIALLVLSEIRSIASSASAGAGPTGDGGGAGDDSHGGGRAGGADGSRDGGGAGSVTAAPDGSDAGVGAGATSGPDASTAPEGLVTLYPGELRVGLVILGAFLVYSAIVAYATPAVWSITVAASVAAAFVLGVSLYSSAANDGSDRSAPGSPAEGGRDGSGPPAESHTGDEGTTDPVAPETFDEFRPPVIETTSEDDGAFDGDHARGAASGAGEPERTTAACVADSTTDDGPAEQTEPAVDDGSGGRTDD